ncbi:hypothetical protein VTK73DRAFT_2936 [Phialemonium thermophilum]|uniref:Uncharacterized protein n=1 Tax=Phialemonium thermophilum TaxID=223376 RepID=A0ABR3X222_9PEZI
MASIPVPRPALDFLPPGTPCGQAQLHGKPPPSSRREPTWNSFQHAWCRCHRRRPKRVASSQRRRSETSRTRIVGAPTAAGSPAARSEGGRRTCRTWFLIHWRGTSRMSVGDQSEFFGNTVVLHGQRNRQFPLLVSLSGPQAKILGVPQFLSNVVPWSV